MPSQAAKDVKFGFWVAAGFAVFLIALSIITGLAAMAVGKGR